MSDRAGARREATTFVGRRLELAWLRSRLDAAMAGFPHLVLVEGEPGIGKSRLAQELVGEARQRGVTVTRGRCYEHLDLAYLPLRDSLFPLLARTVAQRPGYEADLEWLNRTGLLAEAEPFPVVDGDTAARTRQLLSLTHLVVEFAREQPFLLFVDDLDWADAATVDLFRHLLFRLDDERVPLLLLATTRRGPEVREASGMAELRRDARTDPIELPPLSGLEAAELAHQQRASIAVEEATRLAAASGGNPLLVESLAREAPSALWAGPASGHPMVSMIERHLESLDDVTLRVITIASFLVPACTRALLAEVSELPRATLDRALDEAADEHITLEDRDRVSFVHPLYQHTLMAKTPTNERRQIHAAIAGRLLAQNAAGDVIDVRSIAHHLVGAGRDADRVVVAEYARLGGEEALALGAWAEAARNFEAALDVFASDGSVDDRVALHRAAGLSHRGALQLEAAVGHFESALECIGPEADAMAIAELHMWRIRCAVGSRRLLDVVRDRAPLESLIDEVEASDAALAAELLVELAQSYWVDFDYEHSEAAARRAMAVADECGDHESYSRATMALSVPQWARYELLESVATLTAGVARAELAHDPSTLAGGPLFRLPLVLAWSGQFGEAETRALEGCAASEQFQYPLEKGLPLAALAAVAVARGDFDRAELHAHEALLIQRLSGYHWAAGLFLPTLMAATLARGRFLAARDALDTWSETADRAESLSIDLFRRYVDAIEGNGTATARAPIPSLPPTPMVGAEAWAVAIVEIARREGHTDGVRAARDLLIAAEQRGGVIASGLVAILARVIGVAEDLLGEEAQAMATLQRAIEVGGRIGAAPEQGRAQVDLATILLRQGKRDPARELLDRAQATFTRLRMDPDAAHAAQLAGTGSGFDADSLPSVHSVILFTDVVDSTRLTEELGTARYRARARRAEDAITSAVAAHGGRIVSGINLGDGFIGLFTPVDRAIAAARQCIARAALHDLHLHVAIHEGDILVDGPRIFGTPVNMAARICSLTGPDEILVSTSVRESGAEIPGVAFVHRGQHMLKGIALPQEIYAVVEPVSNSALLS